MRAKTIKSLEFYKVLEQVSSFASSKSAKELILSMAPLETLEEITLALDEVEEADKILFQHAVTPSFSFDDISVVLEKANILSILSMGDILKVCRVLKVARSLQSVIIKVPDPSVTILKEMARAIYINKSLEDEIDKSIISDTEISDNASVELKSIRNQIRRTSEGIKAKLYSYVNSSSYSKYLQDNLVTMRNNRYVVPLKAECRGAIPGLIHDQSASGSTIYVEPFPIVELNNKLKTLYIEEDNEIERILRDFTFKISTECGFIQYSFELITKFDAIFSKAYYGNKIKAIKPLFNNNGYVDVQKGRHPLIDPKKVVPNTVYLGKDFNILFITGPNTGGKTVCLKLLGLLEIMGMSGLYVPAQYAMLANFDNVFCDIGDEQSIEQNLSTFSSHITNIINIVNNLTENTLVLFDELGAGTDPTEGASLALSISDYILKRGTKAVITTHYNELKEYAVATENVYNASMDFNPTTYSPTYKLIIGTPGVSNALLIAEKLGLNSEIITKAKEGISNQKYEFENIVLSLEKARRTADENLEVTENLRRSMEEKAKELEKEKEKLFLQRERLNLSVKKETKRLVEEAMEEANEVIASLRKLLDDPTQSAVFEAQRLRKSLKKYIIDEENEFQGFGEELDGAITVGDTVLVMSLNTEGQVVNVNPIKGEAKVNLGKITSNIKLNNLKRIKSSPKKEKVKTKASIVPLFNEAVSPEINLIGLDSQTAIHNLDEYMDKCLRVGLGEVRIIHGYGEGILRKAVQKYLKERKDVLEIREGNFYEGGKGVTFAKI